MGKMVYLNEDNTVVQNKEIDVSDLNGEKVMMDINKGEYFSLNSLGSRIWELIEKPKRIREVINTLLEEYDVSEEKCKDNVTKFLDVLVYADLIDFN